MWPAAPCPTGDGRASSARWSIPAATSSNVVGQPPPLSRPSRRYSRFHAAHPRAARSAHSVRISLRPYCAFQKPPCSTTATGNGPSPSGRDSSPKCERARP